jgi:hypothetical protein
MDMFLLYMTKPEIRCYFRFQKILSSVSFAESNMPTVKVITIHEGIPCSTFYQFSIKVTPLQVVVK